MLNIIFNSEQEAKNLSGLKGKFVLRH